MRGFVIDKVHNFSDPRGVARGLVIPNQTGCFVKLQRCYKNTPKHYKLFISLQLSRNNRHKNPSKLHLTSIDSQPSKRKTANMADTTTPAAANTSTSSTEQKRKMFVPLENNPQVMTHLLQNLGLSSTLSLHDVFSLTDPSLLEFVPRPASALLLVFPVSEGYEKYRREEDEGLDEYQGKGEGEEVTWFRQTIGNSCGLMALLHAAGNGPARDFVGEFPLPTA